MVMRGKKQAQRQFVAMIDVNARIPQGHPIREVKRLSDEVFGRLSPRFEAMYSEIGRPSIPPERLLGARLLMALFSVPSERAFCERLRYDLLFQWFLDLELEEEPFDASTFSKNQQRLLEHQVADEVLAEVVGLLRERNLLSEEHFSVDGTLIDAWASLKSFRPKDEGDQGPKDSNDWGDFSGQKRSNETHESKTDPQAKLLKKGEGKEAKLCYTGHAVMENRHGFCVSFELTPSVGVTESQMALEQLKHGLPDQPDDSQARRADLWVGEDGGRDAPEPLLWGRAHRRGLQVGGLGPEPVALGQAERVAAAGRGAGVSPR
jgi:transposase